MYTASLRRKIYVLYLYFIHRREQLCQKIQLLNHFTLALCPVTLGKWVNVRIGKLNLGCKLEPTAIIITSELNIDKKRIEVILIGRDFDLVLIQELIIRIALYGLKKIE